MDPPKIKGRGTIDARVIKDNKSQRRGGRERIQSVSIFIE